MLGLGFRGLGRVFRVLELGFFWAFWGLECLDARVLGLEAERFGAWGV